MDKTESELGWTPSWPTIIAVAAVAIPVASLIRLYVKIASVVVGKWRNTIHA